MTVSMAVDLFHAAGARRPEGVSGTARDDEVAVILHSQLAWGLAAALINACVGLP
jgi:hypothetical protein